MTVLPYILYLFLISLHAVILDDVISIGSAHLNLAAFLVLAVALYKDDVTAAWFGFFVGLVAAAGGPPAHLGWQALLMAVLALVAGYVRERLNLDSLKAKLLLMFGGILVHNVGVLIISRTDGLFLHLATYALTGTVYTTVVAWLFFLVKERRITMARIKALF
jgi:hypothetical protein